MDTFGTAEQHNIIKNNGHTVILHKNGGSWCNAYGTKGIDSNTQNKYIWRLRIDKKKTMMWIGIASKKSIDRGFQGLDYAFEGSEGNAYRLGKDKKYANGYDSKDIVSIVVDCNKKEISFSVNDKDCGVAYKIDIGPTYYLAVSIYCLSGQSITINEFKTNKKESPNVEEKDELRDLKKQNEALKQENIQLNNQVLKEVQKTSLLEHQKKEIMQKYEILQNKLKEKEHMIEKLQNEKKEREIENIKLKEENKKLKIANIDMDKFETWTSQQILFWIVSLENGRFKKYETQLQKAFVEEDIDGSCIEQVDGTDIKNWGINNFKDRKAMIMHFQRLNQNKKAKKMDNEGANAPTAYL